MSELTRQIIDYSARDEGAEARTAFYAALHDQVLSHIEAQKEGIARTMMNPEEATSTESE